MDALDLRILRHIGLEPFAGTARSAHPWRPEELARHLHETPRLLKDRMARLERDGVVVGFDVQPNLALLGLSSRTYAFPFAVRATRRETLSRLRDIEGVLAYVDYLTDWVTVTLAFADGPERDQRLAQVAATLGGAGPETWFDPEPLPPGRALSRLDWRILRALRGDARVPVREVAERIGVSAKTTQRRLDRLAGERAYSAFARLDARSMDELMMCSLVLTVDMERGREAMGHLHGKLLADAWSRCSAPLFQAGVHYDLVAAPRSPRGLADLLEATSRIPGVLSARGHVATGVAWTPEWLDAQMDARIDALAP